MKERPEKDLAAFMGAPTPPKPTAAPQKPRNACKGCGKAVLVPGGYCTPACAQKHEPVKKALNMGPDLMGICQRCHKFWGALHYLNGKPAYYHVIGQGGCVGVEAWVKKMKIAR